MLKKPSSKATADGSTGGVASGLRWGCFRGENEAREKRVSARRGWVG